MEMWPSKRTSGNSKAAEEIAAIAGHHDEDLFDQNETASGEKTNLATGEPIQNDQEEYADAQSRNINHRGTHEDALPPLREDPNDTAAQWLRDNDPDAPTLH